MTHIKPIAALTVATALLIGATQAATNLVISSSTPTVGADGISVTGGTSTEKWFAGGGASNGVGQTFLTGSNTDGYTLSSYSLRVSTTSQANVGAMAFNLRLGTISGTTFTEIAATTVTKAANVAWAGGDWFTLQFDSPISLDANTTYAVDAEMTSAGAWQGGIPYVYYKNSNVYADGNRYYYASGTPTTVTNAATHDRDFILDIQVASAVPEPGTTLLIGLGGLLFLSRRRRL